MRWWEQEGIDLEGAQEAVVLVSEEEVGEEEGEEECQGKRGRLLDWDNGRENRT